MSSDRVDFFISRAGADKAIAQAVGSILQSAGYQVILQDWDFGHANFVAKMDDALVRSQRIITLLSHAYLSSPFCGLEWQTVFAQDPRNFGHRLVLLRVDQCQPSGILSTLAYTDLVPLLPTPEVLRDVLLARVKPGRIPTSPDAAAEFQRDSRPILHPEIAATANFTGRGPELDQIQEALDTGATTVVVHGLGGVGKSAVARECGWRRRDRHAGVWILNSASAESLQASLIELGRQFIAGLDHVQDRPEAARVTLDRVLPNFERSWLLIYDNLESESLLRQWTPKDKAQVLATSRVQTFSAAVRKVSLESLPRTDSVGYLRQESGRDDLEDAELDGIADDVGDLPLALAHAGAYLRENTAVGAGSYRVHLAQHLSRVPPGFEGRPTVFATYQAAIDAVDKRQPGAAMLMRIAAWLAPDAIPREIFAQDAARYHEPVATLAADDVRLDETLSALHRSSLIRYATRTSSFSVHRLVQSSARNLDDRLELYTALRVLSVMFPRVGYRTWAQCDRIVLHAITVLRAIGPEASDDAVTPIMCARLCSGAAAYLCQRGEFAAAESLFRSALSLNLNAQLRGPAHPEAVANLRGLAGLLKDTNRLADAESLFRLALEIDEARPGDHGGVSDDLIGLAEVLAATDRKSEAEQLCRRALAILESSVDAEDSNLAGVLNNLAHLLHSMDRASEAEPLYRRALAILEKSFDPNEPQLATALNNLARALQASNRLSEAEPLFRRATVILIRSVAATGNEHPYLRIVVRNFLRACEAAGLHGDELLEQLSSTAVEAGLDKEQIIELLEWWQDGQAGTADHTRAAERASPSTKQR